MPTRGGVGQVHRDLGVLDAPRGPGVLALHPDGRGAFLDVAGFVDHQDRAGVAEGVDDVVPQVIAHPVSVPTGASQQVLQTIRSGRTTVLGDGPAILAVQP